MAFQKDPNEIGSLWKKTGAKGDYLTGEIEGIGPVVCFAVKSENPRAPAFRVLRSKPRDAERQVDRSPVEPPTDDELGF